DGQVSRRRRGGHNREWVVPMLAPKPPKPPPPRPPEAAPSRIVCTMRAVGLVSVSLVTITLLATDAQAASNRWCAVSPKKSENCGYATLDQCRAYVLGLGGWCRPNPFPGTAFGTSGTWASGPPRQNRRVYSQPVVGVSRSIC